MWFVYTISIHMRDVQVNICFTCERWSMSSINKSSTRVVATFTVEIISNRSVRLSTGPRLKNRFGLGHFTAEHIFSLSTNNLTYQGGRYEPSPPVKLKNSKPLQKKSPRQWFWPSLRWTASRRPSRPPSAARTRCCRASRSSRIERSGWRKWFNCSEAYILIRRQPLLIILHVFARVLFKFLSYKRTYYFKWDTW